MAVVVAGSTRSADALISYVLEDKADQQGERYVMASGVGGLLVSVARQQMRDVRKRWSKDKPGAFVQAYHVIQSFGKDELDPDDPDAWMTAQKLGHALAEDRFPGRHVLVVTQRDGRQGCVHNHLVVNSIESQTGRSLNSSIVTHARLVEAHERVLEEQGFEQRADLKQAFSDATERYERGEPSGLRRAHKVQADELHAFQRYILWETECEIADELGAPRNPEPFSVTILRSLIQNTLADPNVVDWDTFVSSGRRRGVQIEQRGKKGRGISYGMLRQQPDGSLTTPSPGDRRRCSTLGAAYEMDAVEQALQRNAEEMLRVSAAKGATPTAQDGVPDHPARALVDAPKMLAVGPVEADVRDADAWSVRLVEGSIATEQPQESEPTTPMSIDADASPEVEDHGTHDEEAVAEPSDPQIDSARPGAPRPTPDSSVEEALRKVNQRRRRMNLPAMTAEEYTAHKSSSAAQRARRLRNPELFDEADAPRSRWDREVGE